MDDVYAEMEARRLSWVMSITNVIWLPMAWGLHEGMDIWNELNDADAGACVKETRLDEERVDLPACDHRSRIPLSSGNERAEMGIKQHQRLREWLGLTYMPSLALYKTQTWLCGNGGIAIHGGRNEGN